MTGASTSLPHNRMSRRFFCVWGWSRGCAAECPQHAPLLDQVLQELSARATRLTQFAGPSFGCKSAWQALTLRFIQPRANRPSPGPFTRPLKPTVLPTQNNNRVYGGSPKQPSSRAKALEGAASICDANSPIGGDQPTPAPPCFLSLLIPLYSRRPTSTTT